MFNLLLQTMEHAEAEDLLSATLTEEKETDTKLTEIALSEANVVH